MDACPECGEDRACRQIVSSEGQRCRFHGGASLRGAAHPSFKAGRYSKYLPDRLIEKYTAARDDGELLALRDEVALIDVRMAGLIEQLSSGEHVSKWMQLAGVHKKISRALAKKDYEALDEAAGEIGEIIDSAAAEEFIWNELIPLFDQRRKLVESERKRLVEMQQLITAERAMSLVAAIVGVIKKHVSDPVVLNAIGDDIRAIANGNDRRGPVLIDGD